MSKTKLVKGVRYDEIAGKTVASTGYGFDRMLIAFTDGTVLALVAEGDEAELDFRQCNIDLLSIHWRSDALEAGLITDGEYYAASEHDDAKRIKKLEQELAALKAKGA